MDLHAEAGITPVPTLTTDRLTLRTFRRSDAPVVIDALNHWDVTQWLTRVPFPYAQADFDWFLAEMCSYPDDRVWAIDRDGAMVGTVSLTAELGYWLHPAHHGQGIMSEAARAVCAWHFAQGHATLRSGFHVGNLPSSRLLYRLGFENDHIAQRAETARGDRVDIQKVVLTHARWTACRG